MSANALPPEPRFDTESERRVWQLLRDGLSEHDVVMANLRLTDEEKDHEADLVVLMPDVGVVVIEVKGGSVSVDDTGRWWLETYRGRKRIRPVDQARTTRYALRTYVETDDRWGSRRRIRWSHAVVVPFTELHADFATPDCPRWMISGRNDLPQLVRRIRETPDHASSQHRTPTDDDVTLIVDILRGRHRPDARPLTGDADERAERADRLTLDQATLLNVTRLLHRVEVRGGAGSGKTVLALTQAKELTRGRSDRSPQRVALLCYSIGLARSFDRALRGLSRGRRPAFVGTFHELGQSWGGPSGSRQDSDFWERRLPEEMTRLAATLPPEQKFDAVIVDEAQDFADTWWTPLLTALKDEETGGLYTYTDENQRIFARFGRPPVPLVPLVLDHNLRNTVQIADAFGPLAPMRMTALGGDGPAVRFSAVAADGPDGPRAVVDAADEEVDRLLEQGWGPEDVALLTTGSRHPVHVERFDDEDPSGYWQAFWDDEDVFYGHVLGCKGLERRAVVLCVNQSQVTERSRERLYVGMSRATDELVVVGDPRVVRAMGGEAVARRLGL